MEHLNGICSFNYLQLWALLTRTHFATCKVFFCKGVFMENEEKKTENESSESGFKQEFDTIKNEFEKQLKEQKERFEKELKDRDDVIKSLIENKKNEKQKEQEKLSDFDKLVKNTIELVNKRRK